MLTSRLFFSFTYSEANKALLNAAKDKTDDTTRALFEALNNGANINITDVRILTEINWIGYKYTPLMWAVHNGQIEKVKFLIAQGADVSLKTARGNTILHLAAREGHLDLYYYLAELFPDLRGLQGENYLTSDEIAEKYKQTDIVRACEDFYSNPFFDSAKTILPDEVVFRILKKVSDPVSLVSLKRTNKAWYNFFKDQALKGIFEESLRDNLPQELQEWSWEDLFRHYYPSLFSSEKTYTYDLFFKQMHVVYLIGEPLRFQREKGFFKKLSEALDIMSLHSDWESIEISAHDAKKSLHQAVSGKEQVVVYKQFDEAASDELKMMPIISQPNLDSYIKEKPSRYIVSKETGPRSHQWIDCTERSPIFELTIKSEIALALLKNLGPSTTIKPDDILSIKKWTLPYFYYKAHEDTYSTHETNFRI